VAPLPLVSPVEVSVQLLEPGNVGFVSCSAVPVPVPGPGP